MISIFPGYILNATLELFYFWDTAMSLQKDSYNHLFAYNFFNYTYGLFLAEASNWFSFESKK